MNMKRYALSEGTMLAGKYKIHTVIGGGGFGIIYLAEDNTLKIQVALKEYFPRRLAERNAAIDQEVNVPDGKPREAFESGLKLFAREANWLYQFENCAGVVDILNFFYVNHTAYMVIEYLDGGSLESYAQESGGRVPWKTAWNLMRPVIETLEVLHKNNVIHCDVSPENIMVTASGQVKLIGFGSAREVGDNGAANAMVVNHRYAPPELYQETGKIGPWTDVYSVSAVFYRLICGGPLPEGYLAGQIAAFDLRWFDDSIPDYVNEAIRLGISPQRNDRPQKMEELFGQLYFKEPSTTTRKAIVLLPLALIPVILIPVIVIGFVLTRPRNINLPSDVQDEAISGMEMPKETMEKTSSPDEETAGSLTIYTDASNFTYETEERGIVIIGSDNAVPDLVSPKNIDGKNVIKIAGVGRNVTSIVIPDTVSEIAPYAFRNCAYLKRISIPASVEKIGAGAFDNCMSLTEIIVAPDNPWFYAKGGIIYSYGMSEDP